MLPLPLPLPEPLPLPVPSSSPRLSGPHAIRKAARRRNVRIGATLTRWRGFPRYIPVVGAPDDPSTELLAPGAEPVTAPASTAATSLIGRTLGRFVIMERLGKGGSGEVFRAQQVQLGRSAVIKVLRREVATAPNRVERFLREAKLASRLDHPYAAHIYAFGAEPDSVLWIAMEHVKGITLDELVARR